jgi:hypothetical protein
MKRERCSQHDYHKYILGKCTVAYDSTPTTYSCQQKQFRTYYPTWKKRDTSHPSVTFPTHAHSHANENTLNKMCSYTKKPTFISPNPLFNTLNTQLFTSSATYRTSCRPSHKKVQPEIIQQKSTTMILVPIPVCALPLQWTDTCYLLHTTPNHHTCQIRISEVVEEKVCAPKTSQ